MSEGSKYLWVPASSQASRTIIEQSSYRTTPAQSSGEPTPPCGQRVHKVVLSLQAIKKVDMILKNEICLASQSSEGVGDSSFTVQMNPTSKVVHAKHDNAHSESASDLNADQDTQSLPEKSKRATLQ
jgi:hypothetical protein